MASKVKLFAQIRHDSRVEGLLVRALAYRYGVHRRTVRQALASAIPPPAQQRRWKARKIDLFTDAIDSMLRTDLVAPRKQRHTVRPILARLVDEHGATDLSYSTVLAYVSQRRRQIEAERLARADVADDNRRIGNRLHTVGEDFGLEQPLLRALPEERFEPGLLLTPRVDRHARIIVRSNQYSASKGAQTLNLDHYLEVLKIVR